MIRIAQEDLKSNKGLFERQFFKISYNDYVSYYYVINVYKWNKAKAIELRIHKGGTIVELDKDYDLRINDDDLVLISENEWNSAKEELFNIMNIIK